MFSLCGNMWQAGLTVFLHGLADTNLHPRPFLSQRVDLRHELLLQNVLLHAEKSAQIQYAVLDIFKVPRPAGALVDFVEQVRLASVEHPLGEVGFCGNPVEGARTLAWHDGRGIAWRHRFRTAASSGVGAAFLTKGRLLLSSPCHV